MIEKHCDSNYKYSHQKSAKSFAKAPCKALDIKQQIGTKFTASQLHSFTASQLRASCAQIKQSPTAKFSHIKKYVLQIGTIHQKQNLIWGFQRGFPFGSAGKRGGHRGRENPALNGVFSPPKRGVNL